MKPTESTTFENGRTPQRSIRSSNLHRLPVVEPESGDRLYSCGGGFKSHESSKLNLEEMGQMIPGSFKNGLEGGRGYYINTKGSLRKKLQ